MNTLIHTSIAHGVGRITLNSPKTLNALGQEMAEELLTTLIQWENDPQVKCVFLEGNERAFCAGGDIKALYFALKTDKNRGEEINPACLRFFITEYTLDYKIHRYSKPMISWNSGITMGGGMGLMNGASQRIVTETSILAMPEVSIGLYPDVGATYFLNKLPQGIAKFLALTGARFNGSDAMYLGLSDFYLDSSNKETFLSKLSTLAWRNEKKFNSKLIDDLLENLSVKNFPPSQVREEAHNLNKLADITRVGELMEVIKSFPPTEWITRSLENFSKGSPTSAGIILQQLVRGRDLTLKEAFMAELNLSTHCSLHWDFFEGVRSLLIDKDQSPQWKPAQTDELTDEWINRFFTPLWDPTDHPFSDWQD